MITRRGFFGAIPLVASVAGRTIPSEPETPVVDDSDLYGILYELKPVPDRFYYRGIDVRWTGWKSSQYNTSLKGQWFTRIGEGDSSVIIEADAISDMEHMENKKEMDLQKAIGLYNFCYEVTLKECDGTLTRKGP